MIGRGSASETKVAQNARTTGGRRFTGRIEFLREWTCRRSSLASLSKASTCETPVNIQGSLFGPQKCTSAVNAANEVRDGGGIVERIRVHSPRSFLSNALTSCSRESSGTASGVMMVVVQRRPSIGARDLPNGQFSDHRKPLQGLRLLRRQCPRW